MERVLAGVLMLALLAPCAEAAVTYKDKTISMIVGAAVGGGNDVYARLLARHMGRHLEGNPNIVAHNIPGAGGNAAAATLFTNAPRDGTTIGALTRVTTLDPLLMDQNHPFDPLKFNWLGSLNRETNLLIVSTAAPVKTFDDVFKTEMIVAAAGATTDGVIYPRLINNLLGGKLKIVSGYAGSDEMMLAIERGEVHGRGGVPWSTIKVNHGDLLEQKKIAILVQLALARDPDLPDVPMLMDYVKNDTHRRIFELLFARQDMGRPFVAPPGVPDEIVRALRTAFNESTEDPILLAEAQRLKLDVQLLTGEEMQALLARLYATPPEIVDIVKKEVQGR
jgi:tripartite-type tricarboxylate transporter receptor subunit TctC